MAEQEEDDNLLVEEEEQEEFLASLGANKYKKPLPRQEQKQNQKVIEMRQMEKQQALQARISARVAKEEVKKPAATPKRESITSNTNEDSDLFGSNPTPILGKDKHFLLKKLQQYKSLFPQELKSFKIKKNPSIDDLEKAVAECDIIVQVSSLDNFLNDAILQTIKSIEGITFHSRYDISGLADLLKANKQFHHLARQLCVKYSVFSAVPIEYQMILLVSTTAWIVRSKNINKSGINSMLNEQV